MRGWTHAHFPIGDPSRVGEARRFAALAAAPLGWSDVELGRLALVVTELGTNLLRHASGGQLLIAARPHAGDVEVIAIDEGPGIADIMQSMQDGYSSGSSPGTGLGAIRRLASDFDLYSSVPHGTVCVARVRKAGLAAAPEGQGFDVGAVCLPIYGETVCGDAWGAALDGAQVSALVADGLGHGPEAAKASKAAVDVFDAAPSAELPAMVGHAHQALRGTRGAALCALRVSTAAQTVRCAGAGNVAVRVISGVFDRSMVTQHGTAGLQIRTPEETSMALPQHPLVVIHSDGIGLRWDTRHLLPVLGRDPALVAALLLRHYSRRRDDATVVVLRPKETA